ncbi:MAG TPA: hypothetical protein PK360_02615, partial [bacterium]|nr:hypothetical protein [bacterium]
MRRFNHVACWGLGCLILMQGSGDAAELPLTPVPAGTAASASPLLDAQAPPVEDLVREALANNPSVSVMASRMSAAEEMAVPEGALPDPMVEFELTDVNFPSITVGDDEMSMAGVRFTQGLLFPGKLKARREAARAAV